VIRKAARSEVATLSYTPISRANMAHTGQSKPDSGFGVQAKVLENVEVVPFETG